MPHVAAKPGVPIAPQVAAAPAEPPLCVDLDGTLVATDLLWESVLWLLKRAPWVLLQVPFWLVGGKAVVKCRLAARVKLDVARLPYRPEVLAYLRRQHGAGRPILLVTASSRSLAEAIAAHLGVFSAVLATDETVNLRGERKRRALEERLGAGKFDYLGNDRADLSVWRSARTALLVTRSARLARRAARAVPVERLVEPPRPGLREIHRAVRTHQWVKNLLVFVPLILAHHATDVPAVLRTVAAFAALSLCASSVYLLNDLLDLEADRGHPEKRLRPFAAGTLPIPVGLVLIPLLLGAGVSIALALPAWFGRMLAAYLVLTTAYSFRLKGVAILDVIVLAVLYTIRVVAGGFAAAVAVSPWLIALSIFLFQSLALLKRYAELGLLEAQGRDRVAGRGYVRADRELLGSTGPASGYAAVLVLALYINSHDVVRLYSRPKVLWAVCPLLLYWITHMWLRAHRGQITDDPIVVALEDPVSYLVGGAIVLAMLLSMM
jgi:4-hydroxybenzoate polyprenyltransferase/phosphoserine phosphatase